MKGYVEVYGLVKYETDQAILCDFGLDEDVWLPISQIEDWPGVDCHGEVLMKEWIAKEKGII